MKMYKCLTFAPKAIAVATVVAAVATAGFDVKDTKATATAPTGKCGFLINIIPAGFNGKLYGENRTVTTIGVMDFDAGKSNFIDTKVSKWDYDNAVTTATLAQNTFTLTQGPNAGQFIATTDNGTKWNLMSTNTANTYLLQSVADATHTSAQYVGVCQAI